MPKYIQRPIPYCGVEVRLRTLPALPGGMSKPECDKGILDDIVRHIVRMDKSKREPPQRGIGLLIQRIERSSIART